MQEVATEDKAVLRCEDSVDPACRDQKSAPIGPMERMERERRK